MRDLIERIITALAMITLAIAGVLAVIKGDVTDGLLMLILSNLASIKYDIRLKRK